MASRTEWNLSFSSVILHGDKRLCRASRDLRLSAEGSLFFMRDSADLGNEKETRVFGLGFGGADFEKVGESVCAGAGSVWESFVGT